MEKMPRRPLKMVGAKVRCRKQDEATDFDEVRASLLLHRLYEQTLDYEATHTMAYEKQLIRFGQLA